jgi:hypothetical protein
VSLMLTLILALTPGLVLACGALVLSEGLRLCVGLRVSLRCHQPTLPL